MYYTNKAAADGGIGPRAARMLTGRRVCAGIGRTVCHVRILVISDTHRDAFHLRQALLEQPNADIVLFLGDGEEEFRDAAALLPGKKFLSVAGNCDFSSKKPLEGVLDAAGKTVFYTHGHGLGVKYGLGTLIGRAKQLHADVALFGHTHVPMAVYEDGLYIMNPGSLGHPREGGPTYGVVDITPAGIVLNIVKL